MSRRADQAQRGRVVAADDPLGGVAFGISYYGVETLNIDLGSGDDVFNVQGTTGGSGGFRQGYAAAASIVLFILVLVIGMAANWFVSRREKKYAI